MNAIFIWCKSVFLRHAAAILGRSAFLADFIINYLNAFDSRIMPRALPHGFSAVKPRQTRQNVFSLFLRR